MTGSCEREIQVEYIYKHNLKDEMCAVVTSRNVNKCLHAFFLPSMQSRKLAILVVSILFICSSDKGDQGHKPQIPNRKVWRELGQIIPNVIGEKGTGKDKNVFK